jgi:hypothetical protein
LKFVGFGVELLVAAGEASQRVAGHHRRRVRRVAGTHLGGHRDQRANPQAAQLIAQLVLGQ